MTDNHLLDKVILSIFDHSESHNMQESITISIWNHRVGLRHRDRVLKSIISIVLSRSQRFLVNRTEKLLKSGLVQLGSGDMDGRLAS